jgi:sorting nexin-1/2
LCEQKNQKRAEPETPKVGFMRSFGETLSNAATSPFTKFVEVDEWFDTRRNQLDILDGQLKSLLKSVEAVVKQRKGRCHVPCFGYDCPMFIHNQFTFM